MKFLPGPPFPPQPPLPPLPFQNSEEVQRPGCVAADESLHVLAYLERLGEGWKHFGVLKLGKEQLEKAASAADTIGANDTSKKLLGIAEKLSTITNESQARALAEEFKPIVHEAWELGSRCGSMKLAWELGQKVNSGELTRDEAIKLLQEG